MVSQIEPSSRELIVAASAPVEDLHLHLGRSTSRISASSSPGASATDATHPRFNSRVYGRFKFDGNREALAKRGDRVASTHERSRYSAGAKSRLSLRLRAY